MFYSVGACAPISIERYRDFDKSAENIAGRPVSGAGYGFGERDVSFYFDADEQRQAEQVETLLRDTLIPQYPGCQVWFNEIDDAEAN